MLAGVFVRAICFREYAQQPNKQNYKIVLFHFNIKPSCTLQKFEQKCLSSMELLNIYKCEL